MDVNILKKVIEQFLHEDIGSGDITSEATLPPDQIGTAEFIAKGSVKPMFALVTGIANFAKKASAFALNFFLTTALAISRLFVRSPLLNSFPSLRW